LLLPGAPFKVFAVDANAFTFVGPGRAGPGPGVVGQKKALRLELDGRVTCSS
jgi:hypothetical protein